MLETVSCVMDETNKIFKFSLSRLCEDEPMSINKMRAKAENAVEFDKSLESFINLYTKQPEIDYPDGDCFEREVCFDEVYRKFLF